MENTAKKALDSIPSTYTDLQKQVNEVEDRELKDANGITQELTITDGYAQLTDTATKRLNSLVIKGNSYQLNTSGKNLLLIYKQTQTVNGITLTYDNDNKVVIANGTATSWTNIALGVFDFKKGITYKFVGCPKGGSVDTLYHIEPDGGLFFDIGNGATYMSSEDKLNTLIYFVVTKGVVLNNLVIKPMITTDLNVTYDDYEPYTGGKPSPSSEYPQEIKAVNELSGVMSGKNLLKPYGSYPITENGITFNLMNDGIHVNGKCTRSSCRTFIYSDTLQAGTYYINGIKGASNSRYQVVLYKNNVILNYITTKNFKLELKEKAKIELSLFVYSEYGTFNDLVLPYMICRNENDLYLYTPYQGQSLLNYTLQNPLYKIGDVYDYIDFNRGKIIRNVGVVTFDGSDDELWNKYSNNVSMDGYSVNVSNAIDTTPCICNKLLTTDAISTTLEEAIKVLDNAMYVVLNKIRGLNTTELFKSWLQSNPITVCYQLATPTEKDIPQELLTQLKQIFHLKQVMSTPLLT